MGKNTSTHTGLFYAYRLENGVHCMFIFGWLVAWVLRHIVVYYEYTNICGNIIKHNDELQ